MSMKGGYGLMVDLGDAPASEDLEKLYQTLWQNLKGPEQTFSHFGSIPRGAQGQLCLASGSEISLYTRFEQDSLGYPPGWESPVLLSIGLAETEPELPENLELQNSLQRFLKTIAEILPFRLAVMGHSSLYHVNAEFVSEDWLDLHHELLLSVWLEKKHPLLKRLSATAWQEFPYACLFPSDWAGILSTQSEQEKYLRYKQNLSEALHTPKLQLTWESSEN